MNGWSHAGPEVPPNERFPFAMWLQMNGKRRKTVHPKSVDRSQSAMRTAGMRIEGALGARSSREESRHGFRYDLRLAIQ